MRNFNGYAYDRLSPAWLKKMIKDNESKWQEFSDEEVMRWLYIQLGNRFSFSRQYRYAITDKEKAVIENQAKDIEMRSRRINNTDSVICIDIEEIMQTLLTDLFEIDSRVVVDGGGPHVYLEVHSKDYGRVKLDLQEDLCNIKAGRRTEHFACERYYDSRNYATIPESETERIDKELGYVGENSKYMEDYLEQYREKIEDSKTTDEKVRKAFALLEYKYSDKLKSMKYCERTELYKKVIKDMLPGDKIEHRTFRKNGKLISCFIVPSDDSDETEKYYIFNKEKRSYEEIEKEQYKNFYDSNEGVIKDALDSEREPRVDE